MILTDNEIERLPESIGLLTNLKKCMLAGNKLKTLPESMKNCQNIELIRLAANNFDKFPDWYYTILLLTFP